MDLKLSELNVVVAGGSFGIGASIVEAFLKEGSNVAFCARDQKKIDATIKKLADFKGKVSGASVDVTNESAFSSWVTSMGKIDIFVTCVSALSGEWEESIEVDIMATKNNINAVIPYLKLSNHPSIVYIGSKASSFPIPQLEAYGAAKAAMTHYMKTLSRKLAELNIRVNTVSPGDTLFPGGTWDGIKDNMPDFYQQVVEANPMKRLCTPQEVARVVAFISSPVASYVSGVNWLVDGGATDHIQI